MKKFYEIDSTRVTLREYSWDTPWLLLPLIALLRLLGVRIPGSTDDPPVDSLASFGVTRDLLPVAVTDQFAPLERELTTLGFRPAGDTFIVDARHATKYAFAALSHTSGKVVAQVRLRIHAAVKPPRERLWVSFVTEYEDGTFDVTTNGKPDLLSPPKVRVRRMAGASIAELWSAHQTTLRESSGRVREAFTDDEVFTLEETLHGECCDFHVARGVFRADEILPNTSTELGSLEAEASRHASVLAEMEKLQKNQVGWTGFALWLVVSLVMFAAAGLWQHKLQGLLMLVGVVFVHELGHYLAMRTFGYRNLRMFFIPGIGAAVSGRHYNVAGWKKVIVSLAGPVPGIFAGIALGAAALATNHREWMPLALMAIGLNGFNLIPLLPLDGGWVVHATLFCRHPVLDTGFKLIAALLLLLAAAAGLGWFAGVWGGIMLVGLPLQYRMAQVAAKLRREGVATASAADSIPLATAIRILDELRTRLSPATQPKIVAQNALHIFETINARPPHWAVTILLLMVHAGSFFAAAIGMVVLLSLNGFDAGDFEPPAPPRPLSPFTAADIRTWSGPESQQLETPSATGVTTSDRTQAEAIFVETTSRLPGNAACLLIGNSVVLIVHRDEEDSLVKKWEREIAGKGRKTEDDSERYVPPWRMEATAPDEATAAAWEAEWSLYLELAQFNPAPPWRKAEGVDVETLRRQDQARRFLQRLNAESVKALTAAEVLKDTEWDIRKLRSLKQEEIRKLMRKTQQLQDEARRKRLSELRLQATAEEAELIDLYEKLQRLGPDEEVKEQQARVENSQREISRLIGGSFGEPTEAWFMVRRSGLKLQIEELRGDRPDQFVPAIARRLEELGCVDLKYDVGD